ncbi:uncharacterized protein LOC131632268 [Vicia villosa]|uniref:uncharacterized protein LOC131632268 n=1 Tax=Vicia villosa TaxID=3911 RepID=UPI00273B89C0|nr:uncharacterized protein LOC131632268 [Vicia villosa]
MKIISYNIRDDAKRQRREALLFKADFEKAFDTVDWKFLDYMMEKMGFSEKWRNWISECLRTSKISVLVNGSPTEEFSAGRELRQGDPLSPFLFMLAAEGFNLMMVSSVQRNLFDSYEFGNGEVKVSHIQYADDTIVMGRKSWKNVLAIKSTLQLFELVSGLKVNFHKSSLIGINVSLDWLEEAASVLNCKVGNTQFKYLGLAVGCNHRRKGIWKLVIDIVRNRLTSWNNNQLSIGGRIVLLKSVLLSLPVYYLSFFKAPWKWRLLTEKKILWVKVLECKYGEIGCGGGRVDKFSSLWWRDLQSLDKEEGRFRQNWFDSNLVREVGDGSESLFWDDQWLEGKNIKNTFPELHRRASDKKSSVREALRNEDGNLVLNYNWECNLEGEDQIRVDELGRYEIGGGVIPLKVSVLAWRVWQNRIPTRDNLVKRGILVDSQNSCPFGCDEEESVSHIFFECPLAWNAWSEVLRWLGFLYVSHNSALQNFDHFAGISSGGKVLKDRLSVIWFTCLWTIWKRRNEEIFGWVLQSWFLQRAGEKTLGRVMLECGSGLVRQVLAVGERKAVSALNVSEVVSWCIGVSVILEAVRTDLVGIERLLEYWQGRVEVHYV